MFIDIEKQLNQKRLDSNATRTNEQTAVNVLRYELEWQVKSSFDKYSFCKWFSYRKSTNQVAIKSPLYLTIKAALLIYELCEEIKSKYLATNRLSNDEFLSLQLRTVCESLKIIVFQYSDFSYSNTASLVWLSETLKSIISRIDVISINTDELVALDESIGSFSEKVVIYTQTRRIKYNSVM